MARKEFPDNVLEWMETVENISSENPLGALEYCEKLDRYSKKAKSDYVKGFSLFYRGFCKYFLNDLEEAVFYFSDALNLLVDAEEWNLVARCYNALGNIADFQGDLSLAIDYFFKGLNCCREHELESTRYYLESNIANVYLSLGEPLNAVPRLQECEALIKKGLSFSSASKTVVYANMANSYLLLNELDLAEGYIDLLKKESEDDNSVVNQISCLYLQIRLFNSRGQTEARDEAIQEIRKVDLNSTVIFDALTELGILANLFLEIKNYEAFCALINQIDLFTSTANVRKKTLRLRIAYYKAIGDMDNYTKAAVEYYELSEELESRQNRIISHNIMIRNHLEEEATRRREVEKTNRLLKRKSERDALTGMNNRYKLNELLELSFHRAYIGGSPLAIEILDIDCYKEYNDNYGHQAGDDCLIKIAEAIQSMEEYIGVHTGRYGGDEFLIIYEDYDKEDVEAMAEQLRSKIYNLNLEHKYSNVAKCVTISQGVFHKIPAAGNKTWDFLYAADMALYAVKRKSKNDYFVASSLKEINTFSKMSNEKAK